MLQAFLSHPIFIIIIGPLIVVLVGHWLTQRKRSNNIVCYGNRLRLRHINTSRQHSYLHSHKHKYFHPYSSKQQQVTVFYGSDPNDNWCIKGPFGKNSRHLEGKPVRNGDIIRLWHRKTKSHLHSHSNNPSPITSQQEVTVFDNVNGDNNDNWQVQLFRRDTRDKVFTINMNFVLFKLLWQVRYRNCQVLHFGDQLRLIHVKTGKALHSHYESDNKYANEYTCHQQEVTCYGGVNHIDKFTDSNDNWEIEKPFSE